MKNYLLILAAILCLASCKKKEEDAVVKELSSTLHANSYDINAVGRKVGLTFELGDSTVADESAMRTTALAFTKAIGEPYMKTKDSIEITFVHKGNTQSQAYSKQQLSSAETTIAAVNKFLSYDSNIKDMQQVVDTPVTLQHLVAISNMLQSFKAPDAKDNKTKLVKYDHTTSLVNNEPATVIWVDVENKTEVLHFQFIVSKERNKITYVGINDTQM